MIPGEWILRTTAPWLDRICDGALFALDGTGVFYRRAAA